MLSFARLSRNVGGHNLFAIRTKVTPSGLGGDMDLNVVKLVGMEIPVHEQILPVVSLATANSPQILAHRKNLRIKQFQAHPTDVASPQVQIACMTEQINNFVLHYASNKKDLYGKRRCEMLKQRRFRMMKYLCKKDHDNFVKVVEGMNLKSEAANVIKRLNKTGPRY